MYRILAAAFGLTMLAGSLPASAGGGMLGAEIERAWANARAGGPVSDHDKELLERIGCPSGIDNAFCKQLEKRQYRNQRHRHNG